MKKTAAILICGLTLAVAGCGDNMTERAATGAGAGAVVGGPVGAAAGPPARGRKLPDPAAARNSPSATTTCPRRSTVTGHPVSLRPA